MNIQPALNKYILHTTAPFTVYFIYLLIVYVYLLCKQNIVNREQGCINSKRA